jgi:hypothetical protein
MPMLVLNLGGEMVYVLQQRLLAQNITPAKATKVLDDVVGAMFNDSFIEELFKPQPPYSAASTKMIFERLAHSSIMKLNAQSMGKVNSINI